MIKHQLITGGFVLLLLLCTGSAVAEEVADGQENTVIDQLHRGMSDRLTDFVGQVDSFFSKSETMTQVNRSWLRLRVQGSFRESNDIEWKGNVKFKLVLPNTEQRVRILLSTDDADTRRSGIAPSDEFSGDGGNDVAFALRFLRKAIRDHSIKFDLGAKTQNSKAVAFARFSGFARKELSYGWSGTLSNSSLFYSDSDYEVQLNLNFDRPLAAEKNIRFSSSNRIVWERASKGSTIQPIAGFYFEFNEKISLATETILTYVTSPPIGTKRFAGGTFRIRLRQNAFRDWFYYEVWPSVDWLAENDYSASFGIMLRAEAVIGRYGN